MDTQQDHLEDIKQIRSIMERSSKFLTLSGFPGIFAGIAALIGVATAYWHFNIAFTDNGFYKLAKTSKGELNSDFCNFLLIDIGLVLLSSLLVSFLMTFKKAKQQSQPIWDATAKRLLINILIPLFVGAVYCLILLYHGLLSLIAPATLLFYGLALLNASKYTLNYVIYLGIGQILIGLTSAYFIDYGLVFWALGFGVLHIIYGIVMYLKFDK